MALPEKGRFNALVYCTMIFRRVVSLLPASRQELVCRAWFALAATALTGCLSVHTHTVAKTVLAPDVRNASLQDLQKQLQAEYDAIQTLNLAVDITATTGGEHQGEVKELPTFAGYIFLRKPGDLRVLMLLPVIRSRALDMVSDGKDFKLLISAPKSRAITGPDEVTKPSRNGLENLRPNIIRDALQIPPVGPDEYIALTENSRVMAPAKGRKEAVEEPDYDVSVLRIKKGQAAGHVLERVRVVRFSRVTLLPYQQDIYDPQGRVATSITYDKYQTFGELRYPTSILIKRPLDEYTLRIDVAKLVANSKLDDEQFALKIPEGIPVQKM